MAQVATAEDAKSLRTGFADPTEAAWPRTWWHWNRGAVSKRGIIQDLEWMNRVGIAGFQLADVNFGGEQTIEAIVNDAALPHERVLSNVQPGFGRGRRKPELPGLLGPVRILAVE